MRDYIKRFIIAGIIALCIGLLFLGGKNTKAASANLEEATEHWIWPVDGVITDTYGTRQGSHKGIDIAGVRGTPVMAVDDGIVTKSYYSSSYGHVVFIKHANNLETVYAHLQKRYVNEGQIISQGDLIGEMGSTGDSSGNHLHFEVHQNEWTADKRNAVNPVMVLEKVEQGESVQAMKKVERAGRVMTASAKMPVDEESGEVWSHANTKHNEVQTDQTKINESTKNDRITHIVQPGENLWTIAERYQVSVTHIEELNNIKDERIYPNQKLIVKTNNLKEYVVKQGDTLGAIAAKVGTTIEDLMKQNSLTSDLIFPEQVLVYRLSQ